MRETIELFCDTTKFPDSWPFIPPFPDISSGYCGEVLPITVARPWRNYTSLPVELYRSNTIGFLLFCSCILIVIFVIIY